MRSHILIIAWFDHNFWRENLSASVSLIGGNCQKKVVMSKSFLHEEMDIHPAENIYNLNISITRLYVQVLL